MIRQTLQLCLSALVATSTAAQTPARTTHTVSGTVEGAVEGTKTLITLWHNDMKRCDLQPVAEGFAKDGAFTFTEVPWFAKQQWGYHKVVLVARSGSEDSYRVCMVELRGDTAARTPLKLTMGKSIEVRGTLIDADTGEPIHNAWVWPAILGFETKQSVWLTEPHPLFRTTTNAQGRFVIGGLPNLEPIRLLAGGKTHGRSWIHVDDRTDVQGSLRRGGLIRGVVLLPDGKPAARVKVSATGRMSGYGRTYTDEDGSFELSSLAVDEYKVFATAKDLTVIALLGLSVKPGSEIENQTVQLVAGGFIVGRILDEATGKPFVPGPSTDVAMYGPARGPGGSCETTPVLADGTFRIRAPQGENRIYLRSAKGYNEPTQVVTVTEGKETEVLWKLRKGKPPGR